MTAIVPKTADPFLRPTMAAYPENPAGNATEQSTFYTLTPFREDRFVTDLCLLSILTRSFIGLATLLWPRPRIWDPLFQPSPCKDPVISYRLL
jgi:hypothetical protein